MSQTILDEYLASLDEEDSTDCPLPDPKPYGFDSVASMLTEAQDAMMELGATVSEQKRTIAAQAAEIERLKAERDAAMQWVNLTRPILAAQTAELAEAMALIAEWSEA